VPSTEPIAPMIAPSIARSHDTPPRVMPSARSNANSCAPPGRLQREGREHEEGARGERDERQRVEVHAICARDRLGARGNGARRRRHNTRGKRFRDRIAKSGCIDPGLQPHVDARDGADARESKLGGRDIHHGDLAAGLEAFEDPGDSSSSAALPETSRSFAPGSSPSRADAPE
jgi:hypothetical protein